jgi:hypothetical protein
MSHSIFSPASSVLLPQHHSKLRLNVTDFVKPVRFPLRQTVYLLCPHTASSFHFLLQESLLFFILINQRDPIGINPLKAQLMTLIFMYSLMHAAAVGW